MSADPISVRRDPSSAAAGLQAQGYRRGFVLGLTLAEAALLLIFVIMLLLVVGFERRDRAIRELQERQKIVDQLSSTQSVESLQEDLRQLSSLREVAQKSGHKWDEEFMELVQAVANSPADAKTVDAARALQEREAALQRAIEKLSKIESSEAAKGLADKVVEQEASMRNLQGQNEYFRQELAKVGKGGVLPPCWVTPDGKIEYLLDVVLDSRGIRARESYPASRQAERDRLGMPKLSASRIYSQGEFRTATYAAFAWSQKQDPECRFYVTIYDATAPHEKLLYKQLMETVEGHFYKRLAKNAPPF